MRRRKILNDPSFWALLLVNLVLVYKYEQRPQIFTTLIWLYFSQNILYGLFNFLDMLTSPRIDESGAGDAMSKSSVTLATFFLFHFGFFHFIYFFFLITMQKTGPFDWGFYKEFLAVFFFFQLFHFIQHKIQDKQKPTSLKKMFIRPYARVVPMHLCLLLPAFFGFSHLTTFLILKVIMDMLMYVLTSRPDRIDDFGDKMNVANIQSSDL